MGQSHIVSVLISGQDLKFLGLLCGSFDNFLQNATLCRLLKANQVAGWHEKTFKIGTQVMAASFMSSLLQEKLRPGQRKFTRNVVFQRMSNHQRLVSMICW
jgi:hypothetical protein